MPWFGFCSLGSKTFKLGRRKEEEEKRGDPAPPPTRERSRSGQEPGNRRGTRRISKAYEKGIGEGQKGGKRLKVESGEDHSATSVKDFDGERL